MAYRIIYCPTEAEKNITAHRLFLRIAVTAGMMVSLVLISKYYPPGAKQIGLWLLPRMERPVENALRVMGESVAAGKGWYHGAVAFGRTILELAG